MGVFELILLCLFGGAVGTFLNMINEQQNNKK
jgi:hypothetical protein